MQLISSALCGQMHAACMTLLCSHISSALQAHHPLQVLNALQAMMQGRYERLVTDRGVLLLLALALCFLALFALLAFLALLGFALLA